MPAAHSDAPVDRIARQLSERVQDQVRRGLRMPRRHIGAFSVGPTTNTARGMVLRWDGKAEFFPDARNAAEVADRLEAEEIR